MNNHPISFSSISGIIAWTGHNQSVKYMEGSEKLPYIEKNNIYYYFAFSGNTYKLIMTSIRDLGSKILWEVG